MRSLDARLDEILCFVKMFWCDENYGLFVAANRVRRYELFRVCTQNKWRSLTAATGWQLLYDIYYVLHLSYIRVKIQDEKVCGKKAVTVNEKIRKTNRQNKSQKVDFQKAFLSHTCAVYFGGDCFGYAQLHWKHSAHKAVYTTADRKCVKGCNRNFWTLRYKRIAW